MVIAHSIVMSAVFVWISSVSGITYVVKVVDMMSVASACRYSVLELFTSIFNVSSFNHEVIKKLLFKS